MPAQPAAQIPAHPPEADALAAFLATLTPQQRAMFESLLSRKGK